MKVVLGEIDIRTGKSVVVVYGEDDLLPPDDEKVRRPGAQPRRGWSWFSLERRMVSEAIEELLGAAEDERGNSGPLKS